MKYKRTEQEKLKRIPELDGLRGIAILSVVSFHYLNNQLVGSENAIGKLIYKLTSFGWIGVDLFFILSGFLIGTILIQSKNSKNYFSTFYIRRVVRIIPNYFLLILIFMGLLAIPFFANNYFLTGNNVIPAWSYFAMVHNFYMASLDNLGNSAMSVTWSIGIEEQFYIIFPLVIYLLKDKWIPYLLGITIVLAIFFRMQFDSWIPPYVLLHCRMDAIAFGALVAYFNYHYNLREWVNTNFKWLTIILTTEIILCGYFFYRYQDLGVLRNTYYGIFFSISLVIAITKKDSYYAALLRNKALMWVGTISYSLYLFHYMILGLFHHLFNNGNSIGIENGKDILISISAFAFSLLFAFFIYKRLETPMIKIGKRFQY